MSDSFFNRYDNIKLAGGFMDLLDKGKRFITSRAGLSEVGQTAAGLGSGMAFNAFIPKDVDPGVGVPLKAYNFGIGALLGNPRLRRSIPGMYSPAAREGLAFTPEKLNLGKLLGWGAGLKVPINAAVDLYHPIKKTLDAGPRIMESAEKKIQAVGDNLQQTSSSLMEKLTGQQPGESNAGSFVRRNIHPWIDIAKNFGNDPTGMVKGWEGAPISAAHKARLPAMLEEIDKYWNQMDKSKLDPVAVTNFPHVRGLLAAENLRAQDATDPTLIAQHAGEGLESVLQSTKNLAANMNDPQVRKSMESVGYVGDLAKKLKDTNWAELGKNVAANMNDTQVRKSMESVGYVGDLAKKLKDTNWAELGKNVASRGGLALGGTLAAVGGYNLLRDKLNYNRVKAEREAKMRGPVQKTAAPWYQHWLMRRALPAAVVGGTEGAFNYSTDPEHPGVAAISGGLGAIGGSMFFKGKKNFAINKPVVGGTLASMFAPRSLSLLSTLNKGMAESQARDKMMPYAYGGAAVVGAGLLYLMNEWINKDPAPGPSVNSTVFAGGTGGPDNPNVGGKIRVTLPTRRPGDHETTVEVPMENIGLPNTIFTNIRRDTKRRLRLESDARTFHRADDGSLVAPKMAYLIEFHGGK